LILLFGTHIYLTIRLRLIQRFIGYAIKLSFSKSVAHTGPGAAEGDISHFASLMTALAGTIGTGNIVGVATAVASGGPGAVFWMWLTGVFGIATKYAEAVLSVRYRVRNAHGEMAGGPMYVLEHGLKMRWLGMVFAFFTALAAFGIGNMVQANSISTMLQQTQGVPTWVTGIVLTVLTAFVVLGGIKSIARYCSVLVPVMALLYILGCVIILLLRIDTVPATVMLILKSAFSGHAVVGGFLGAGMREAMRFGVARGLFSNESGLGSAPIVAAAARTKNPVEQGLVSATGTFWDTVVICLLTGIVVVGSGAWSTGKKGAAVSHAAFAAIPVIGPFVLSFGLITFVFSTILGWSYFGEKAAEYLWGEKVVKPYRVLWVAAVMLGSVASLPVVWALADILNGLMAVPNLISLILLTSVVVAESKKHLKGF
jgi:AGCS family alanine or glycine:cation symporter